MKQIRQLQLERNGLLAKNWTSQMGADHHMVIQCIAQSKYTKGVTGRGCGCHVPGSGKGWLRRQKPEFAAGATGCHDGASVPFKELRPNNWDAPPGPWGTGRKDERGMRTGRLL